MMEQPVMTIVDDDSSNTLADLWLEICAVLLAFGLAILSHRQQSKRHHLTRCKEKVVEKVALCMNKNIAEQGTAGKHQDVLLSWHACKDQEAITQKASSHLVKAFLAEEPSRLVEEVSRHITLHQPLGDDSVAGVVVDAVAATGNIEVIESLQKALESNEAIRGSPSFMEAMAGAYAHVGLTENMDEYLHQVRSSYRQASAKCYCNVLRGLLRRRQPCASIRIAKEMLKCGYTITPYLVTDIYRCFVNAEMTSEVMQCLPELPPTSHAVVILLEHCEEKRDAALARNFTSAFDLKRTGIPRRGQESMLKTLVSCGDAEALTIFEHFQKSTTPMPEGFLVSLLTKCAESKFLRFAEKVMAHARATIGLTVVLYSAHMKVYATLKMFSEACNLYDTMLSEGMMADETMRSPLLKYAAECGREDLAQAMAELTPNCRAHRWISSIRACAKHRDVERSFGFLQKALEAGCGCRMIYNCVLDVCAAAADVDRSRELLKQMHADCKPDVVTYNTVLKAYAVKGDLGGAKQLLTEMEAAGLPPNDISYNIIVNIAATNGGFHEAWEVVASMTRKGTKSDSYTISALLKAAKKSKSLSDLERVFVLMEHEGIDVAGDEVLMTCALELCMGHGLKRRVAWIIEAADSREGAKKKLRHSQHAYCVLFQACAELGEIDRCLALWHEMVNVRGLEPTKACLERIVEALANHGKADTAADTIEAWEGKVGRTPQLYTGLLKGLERFHGKKGLALIHELRAATMKMKTMVYNLIIEECAKSGCADDLPAILDLMHEDECKPDNFTAALMVKAYCYSGKLSMAMAAFDQARLATGRSDTVAYNTLLDGCIRHNDFALADKLVEGMETYAVTPSIFTVSTIVKMWGRRRQLDKCFEAVKLMSDKYGLSLNGPSSNCLLSACVINGDAERAFKVLSKIRGSGQVLDPKICGSLIALASRQKGSLDEAVRLAEDVVSSGSSGGQELEPNVFDQLFSGLQRAGRLQDVGLPLARRLRSRGATFSTKTISLLAQAA